jgi:hypothetical protein
MEDYIKNNKVFRQNIEKQLLVLNKDNKVQKAWIETRLGRRSSRRLGYNDYGRKKKKLQIY